MSHTPIEGPWKINGTTVSDGYRFWVEYKTPDYGEFETGEEARQVVRRLNAIEAKRDLAVTSHDALVAAVKAAESFLERLLVEWELGCSDSAEAEVITRSIRAALALADPKETDKTFFESLGSNKDLPTTELD